MTILSVLIPVYNSAQTLQETLDSVKTSYNHEIIIIDDCSDDNGKTHALLERLAEKHTVLYQEKNQGPGAALTRGAQVAKGKYLMQLDSDDILTEGALDKLIGYLEDNPGVDVVWGDLITFGDVESKKAMAPALDPWYVTYLNNMPCCAMMRRTAFDKAGGWRIQTKGGYHDWGMWIALSLVGSKGVKLPFVMLKYRVSSSSLFLSTKKKYLSRRQTTLAAFKGELGPHRRKHYLRSQAPWRLKLLLPIYLRLPIEDYKKSRYAKALAAKYWFKDEDAYQARLNEARAE
jgi:glycosyltransferase involved in cell wall biosynthesis